MNQVEHLNQQQIIPWQKLFQLNPKKNMKGRMKHKTERKAKKKTKKTFQLNDTEQQLTACKAEVIRLETMVTEKEKTITTLKRRLLL